MKRVILIGIFAMTLLAGKLQAQNCEYIVGAKYGYNMKTIAEMPKEKLYWCCRFSTNKLFEADTVPRGARVYNISEVKNIMTQETLPDDFVVNMDSLSCYAYDFDYFHPTTDGEPVYFRTPNSAKPFLGVRSFEAARAMTEEQERLWGASDPKEMK